VVLEPRGTDDALAVLRPDGSIVVQLVNPDGAEAKIRVQLGKKAWDAILPARSFATMIVPAQAP
jgi:hypothetical protein